MPNTSQIAPTVVSCYGGLVLNKDIFSMRPGEALQLTTVGVNCEVFGTTLFLYHNDED